MKKSKRTTKAIAGITALIFTTGLVLWSCNREKQLLTANDYLAWMDDEANGLVRAHHVNGMEVRVKYLPAEYLVHRELGVSSTRQQRDSLLKLYESSLSFLMTLGPDAAKGERGDVMQRGLQKYSEYAERVHTMNFDLEQLVRVEGNGISVRPVLSAMENTYGLQESRSIIFAFALEPAQRTQLLSGDIDFIYEDELFELGILHFAFNQKDLQQLPAFPGR